MIKVGTDFSGIGSPEAALKRLNIPHHNVFACDIDKYAKQSFLALNNPFKFYDNITTRDYKEVDQLDLYVAGFPCQSFSMAGKREGFNDTRGTLFYNVAEFIKVNQPACFILENVKGLLSHDNGKTYQTITDVLTNGGGTLNGQMGMDTIEDGLGYHVYTQVLNTKDYGIPQNRERIFIVGFKHWRTFNFPVKIPLKLKLKDILQDNPNSKYILSEEKIKYLKRTSKTSFNINKNIEQDKIKDCSRTITSSYYKCGRTEQYICHSLYPRSSKTGKGGTGHLSKQDGTSYCLDTGNNQAVEWVADYRNDEGLRKRKDKIVPCLTRRRHSESDISSMPPIIKQNKIRRLTPLECWRLQGFTDEEFYKAQKVNSDTQLYKQAGNSITVNVMAAILKKIYLK